MTELYKAVTRRVPTNSFDKFEGYVIEANPSCRQDDDGLWIGYLDAAHTVFYGQDSREEALAAITDHLRRTGWRDDRATAEAELSAELERRRNFRADGSPRGAPKSAPSGSADHKAGTLLTGAEAAATPQPPTFSAANGALFKRARQALDCSAEQMAHAVRVQSGRTVRRWEAGDRDIPGPAWVALSYMLRERGKTELAAEIDKLIGVAG